MPRKATPSRICDPFCGYAVYHSLDIRGGVGSARMVLRVKAKQLQDLYATTKWQASVVSAEEDGRIVIDLRPLPKSTKADAVGFEASPPPLHSKRVGIALKSPPFLAKSKMTAAAAIAA